MSVASASQRLPGRGQLTDAELDLPALGAALWRQKWKIIGPAVLVGLLAFVVVEFIPAKYLSESRVLIEQRSNIFLRPDADKDTMDRGTVDQEAVTSQVQLILSRDLAIEVIAKLKLAERAEFDPMLAGISPLKSVLALLGLTRNPARMTAEERVLESYYERLNVYAIEKSRVIVIDFLSEDPELAARVANAIAAAYLVRQQAAKQEQARSAGIWLADEIESLRKRVAEAEARVEAFRAKSNLLVGTNNTTLSAQQLGELNAQLTTARAQKADAEAKAKLIREMLRSGGPIESSDILNSELIRRLSEQRVTLRAQLAEQSSSLLDGHPRIKELKAQIADLDRQIRSEAEKIARALENDAKFATARVDSLTASLDQLKSQAAGTNEQDVHLRALEREAKAQRDLLESYLAKYREATARDTLNSAPADARVISRATVSNIPAYPKKLPTVLIATLATAVLCAGWLLTRELLAAPSTVRPAFAPAVPAEPAVPVTERVVPADEDAPQLDYEGAPQQEDEATQPIARIASTIEGAADGIRSAREDGEAGNRVAVLGAGPAVDTTGPAIRLARLLSTSGRVVLVGLGADDGALKATATDPSTSGLAELASGTASFRNIITRDRVSGLNLIVAGRAPVDRLTILSSPGMTTYFDALARTYDYLVIDAGPLGGPEMEAVGEIAPCAVVIAQADGDGLTAAARDALLIAGFANVIMLAGADEGTSIPNAAAA